jgi:hypothetical protein
VPHPNEVNDYVITKSPMMQNEKNETTNPFRGQSPDCNSKISKKVGRNASNSLSKSRKRSGNNRNG